MAADTQSGELERAAGDSSAGPVDLDRLAAWLRRAGFGDGPLTDVAPIAGGTQNVLLRFAFGDRQLVLRRPPEHKRANSDETMRREARLLRALGATSVSHPRLVAACDDADVLGAAFYVMEPVEGFNPSAGLPREYLGDLAFHHQLGIAAAAAIASLGELDHVAIGLGDFGRAEGWLERQTGRWRAQLARYAEHEGFDSELPAVDEVGAWLDRERPRSWRPGLIHGDFHLGNVIIAPGRPEVAAIVDWELATLGDPLLDLGNLLSSWPRPDGDAELVVLDLPGLPTREELIAAYRAHSTRDLSELRWYEVLAHYRLGIILEGTYARALAGKAPAATGERLHRKAFALLREAERLIGRST